jgi:hypothetical protein
VEILLALQNSQDISRDEAEDIRCEMAERVLEGEDPEEVLAEYGLEPDYVFDII